MEDVTEAAPLEPSMEPGTRYTVEGTSKSTYCINWVMKYSQDQAYIEHPVACIWFLNTFSAAYNNIAVILSLGTYVVCLFYSCWSWLLHVGFICFMTDSWLFHDEFMIAMMDLWLLHGGFMNTPWRTHERCMVDSFLLHDCFMTDHDCFMMNSLAYDEFKIAS